MKIAHETKSKTRESTSMGSLSGSHRGLITEWRNIEGTNRAWKAMRRAGGGAVRREHNERLRAGTTRSVFIGSSVLLRDRISRFPLARRQSPSY